jgi:hypothetical protein
MSIKTKKIVTYRNSNFIAAVESLEKCPAKKEDYLKKNIL